jgi:hypothetical protein
VRGTKGDGITARTSSVNAPTITKRGSETELAKLVKKFKIKSVIPDIT